MKTISCSAPAKVILSGEHAVVYGKPGLVTAINLRLKFTIWQSRKKISDKAIVYLSENVRKYLNREKIKFGNTDFEYRIDSKIPSSRGLGSSAALSVAATAAMLKFFTGKEYPKELVNNLAYGGEKYFHKNPSGVDVCASCFGGLIFYRKEFEFLKNISSLNYKIPKKIEDRLFLIDTGRAVESTAEMVEMVGKSYNAKPKFTEEILADIEKTTKKTTISLIKKDNDFFAKNILENEIYLRLLGVESKKTQDILAKLVPFGVGKVTGAGGMKDGSGFILFYSDKENALIRFLKNERLNYYKLVSDYKGLIYED